MASLDDHAHALRFDRFVNGVGNLTCEPLLYLQPPREDLDQAGNLAQPDYLSFGNISHMHLAEEGQHVMLAEREDLDVLDDHHLVVVFVEERAAQDRRRILSVPLGQEGHRLLNPAWSGQQSVAAGVLAIPAQNLAQHLLRAEFAQPFVQPHRSANAFIHHNRLRHDPRSSRPGG